MRLPFACSYIAAMLFSWDAVGVLQASTAVAVTVNAPRPGAKLTSIKDGSVTIYQPLKDVLAKGNEHPMPRLPPTATAKKLGGKVELVVETAKSGEVRKVIMDHSSGSPLLDEVARTWVQYVWRYPATEQPETHREQVRFDEMGINAAKQVSRDLSYPNTPRPIYPAVAICEGWQGTVQMKVVSDGSGRVKQADVVKSSSVRLLDLEAKSWCETYWTLPRNAVTDCSITYRLP